MSRVTEVIQFRPEHRAEIAEAPAAIGCNAGPDVWYRVADQGGSITLRVDGRTVMCGGVVETEPGLYEAWAAIDVEGRRYALAIHRTAQRVMNAALETCRRLHAYVVWDGFPEAHRWVKRLGFQFVCVVRGHRPDGRDCALYALEA